MKKLTFLVCLLIIWNVHCQEGKAKIRILVNSAYNDSDSTIQALKIVSDLVPYTKTRLDSDKTISHLLVENYNFGPSDLYEASEFLTEKILKINGYERPEDVKAGEVLIPTIAPRAFKSPNPNNLNNLYPKTFSYEASLKGNQPILQRMEVDDFRRKGAQESYLEIEVTLDQLDSIQSVELENYLIKVEKVEVDLDFVFESNSLTEVMDNSLFKIQFDSLKYLINTKGIKRKNYLFILDTGWPNEKYYKSSLKSMEKILDVGWKKLGIPSPKRTFKDFVEPSCNHVKQIHSSIRYFEELDLNAVEVIYLPLSKEQGASTILTELIRFHKIYSDRRLSKNFNSIDSRLRRKTLNKIDGEVKNLIDKLPETIGDNCASENVRTDYSIIYAIQDLADLITSKENNSYFINFSWNPMRNRTHLKTTDVDRGFFVVSAGNNGRDIIKNKTPFGNLVSKRGDIVVAFNVNPDSYKANCKSGTLSEPRRFSRIKGIPLGYYGDLSAVDCGGTSFSSPRIAWFLALGEAIRSDYSTETEIRLNIQEDVLKSLTSEPKNDFHAIWFNPVNYLKTIK